MKLKAGAVLVLVLSMLIVSFSGCVETELTPTPTPISTPTAEISINVYVKPDQPKTTEYELLEGTPTEVGVYKFYLQFPDLAGSGVFEKVDSIPLKKIDASTFYGERAINKINDTLCIGYPSTNYIDGKSCVKIDQSKEKVNITVYYWRTTLPPLPSSAKDTEEGN